MNRVGFYFFFNDLLGLYYFVFFGEKLYVGCFVLFSVSLVCVVCGEWGLWWLFIKGK